MLPFIPVKSSFAMLALDRRLTLGICDTAMFYFTLFGYILNSFITCFSFYSIELLVVGLFDSGTFSSPFVSSSD
jgi:hypothetical protein